MQVLDRDVPLVELGKTSGPAPSSKFIRSVRRSGVIVPVLLRQEDLGDGVVEYRIIDGNRRIAAARRARRHTIPARILVGVSADEAARLTLSTNILRSGNHVSEFWAIKHLERAGVARQRIADDAGMTQANLRVRDRLSALDRRVFVGFAEGKISTTVALSVSRMSRADQREMGELFAAKGRLRTTDVRAYSHTSGRRDRAVPEVIDLRPDPGQSPERLADPASEAAPIVPGTKATGEVLVARAPEADEPEHVTGAEPELDTIDVGRRIHVKDEHPPEATALLPAPAPGGPVMPSRPDTPPEPLPIVRRNPVQLPPPAPTASAPVAMPDDLRIAVRSIARRACHLDIPERELTRVIQEAYRERSAALVREGEPVVGERYA